MRQISHNNFSKTRQSGFMAIELLVVMALILVLFCIYWGGGLAMGGNRRKNFAGCGQNLQFIHTALQAYANDNNDRFPSIPRAETSDAPLALLIPKATTQTGPFICPSSGDLHLREGESIAKKRISYAYVMGYTNAADPAQFVMSDEQIDANPKGAGAQVFGASEKDAGFNHGPFGGNVLMMDGSVQTIGQRATTPLTFTNATLLNPRPRPKSLLNSK